MILCDYLYFFSYRTLYAKSAIQNNSYVLLEIFFFFQRMKSQKKTNKAWWRIIWVISDVFTITFPWFKKKKVTFSQKILSSFIRMNVSDVIHKNFFSWQKGFHLLLRYLREHISGCLKFSTITALTIKAPVIYHGKSWVPL